MALLEINDILNILPHRYPMLLVDRILECDYKTRIVGIKNLTMNELFFQGHFPSDPIMPGVMQLEAMAQVGGILMNKMLHKEGAVAFFLAIDNARFRRIIRPGDQMRIEVVLQRTRLHIAQVHGDIFVDNELASEADLKFSFKSE